jgi:hypothetical protein
LTIDLYHREIHLSERRGWKRADAIIGLLMVVILAGILTSARSRINLDANRSNTINNLKQIGLAFQNHNDTNNCLPNNGGANDADELKKVNYGWHNPNFRNSGTWATQILPFLEASPFRITGPDGVEPPAVPDRYPADSLWQLEIKYYLCAERGRRGFKTSREKACYPGPVTDFAINVFINSPPTVDKTVKSGLTEESLNRFARDDGTPAQNGDWAAAQSKMTTQGISDGASNTILLGGKALPLKLFESDEASMGDEGIFSPGNWRMNDKKKTLTSTGTGRGHFVVANPPSVDQTEYPEGGGVPWMYRDSELTGEGAKLPYGLAWGGPFKEGVLFLFADGKVRTVTYEQKGTIIFAKMLYPNDGRIFYPSDGD